jgi:hypothetical protein
MPKNQGKELELLVTKIQQNLAPSAKVIHNVHIDGKDSGMKRQIDVLMRQKIGQCEMMIIIQCKDHAKRADVNVVGEFHSVMNDVRANKGILVCPRGFTKGAKTLASNFHIDLYSPFDTDPHKWQVKPKAPALCDFRSAAISFKFACSSPLFSSLPENFVSTLTVFDNEHNPLGTIADSTINRWNEGKFPIEPGEHMDLDIFEVDSTLIDNGNGQLMEASLTASIWVNQTLYFGQMPISKISGFKDEQTGNIITNAFEIGLLDPNEVKKNWEIVKNENEVPVRPLLKVMGLVGHQAD